MINTVHVGIGPIGQKMIQYAVERGCFNIVGAVDPGSNKAGKELGELCGIKPLGITVSGNLEEAIRGRESEVAIVTTVSSVVAFEIQIAELAKAKLHIVSSCEELFYPWNTQPAFSIKEAV